MTHLRLVEPVENPFQGEVMDFLILALWGAGQSTDYIAASFAVPEFMIAERIPVLLRGRAAFRQVVAGDRDGAVEH